MLSDGKIIDIAEDFESQYIHGGVTFDEFDSLGFARAIEREATEPLIEQIKEDEALMRDVLDALIADANMKESACSVAAEAIRQRLEEKK